MCIALRLHGKHNSLKLFLVIAIVLVGITPAACGNRLADARSLESKGDLQGAVALYREQLKSDSDNVVVLAALGSDLMLLGQFDEALPVQEKVVALDAKDAETRIELGFNYLSHQGQPAKAVQVLGQAATIQASAKNLTFLSQALIQTGDLAGAEISLDKALKTDPKYGYSYVVLIGLLQKQNRTDEAAQVRTQALQQGVDSKLLPQIGS